MYDSRANNRYPAPLGVQTTSGMRAGAAEDELLASLREVLYIIQKRLLVILLVPVVLVGVAVGISLGQTPTYESSIKILVGEQRGIVGSPADVTGLQQLTQTMVEGLNSRRVAEGTIQKADLRVTPEEFLDHLSVEQINATQFIRVAYTDTDPQRAQRVADTVGEVFSKEISGAGTNTDTVSATLWDRAVVPEEPISPSPLRSGLVTLVIGLILGIGLAFLLEYFDDSWRSAEEVEQFTGVPVYGVIPTIHLLKGRGEGQ